MSLSPKLDSLTIQRLIRVLMFLGVLANVDITSPVPDSLNSLWKHSAEQKPNTFSSLTSWSIDAFQVSRFALYVFSFDIMKPLSITIIIDFAVNFPVSTRISNLMPDGFRSFRWIIGLSPDSMHCLCRWAPDHSCGWTLSGIPEILLLIETVRVSVISGQAIHTVHQSTRFIPVYFLKMNSQNPT